MKAAPPQQPRPERELNQTAADIRLPCTLSDSAQGFKAGLQERGIALGAVTKEEADRSHGEAAFAKEIGNHAPKYREGEIVALNERGQVYQLTRQTTGDQRAEIEKFLGLLDRGQLANRWLELGTVWAHKDGKGYDVNLGTLPVGGFDGRITLRVAEAKRPKESVLHEPEA